MVTKTIVNRWETRGQRYWIETYTDNTYRTDNGGGSERTPGELKQMISGVILMAKQIDNINYRLVH